jgi:hypothetical protein
MTENVPEAVIHEDTLEELEIGFGIRFPGKAYKDSGTLGGLFDVIWNELAFLASAGGRCPTAVSFYQIKRAILSQCPSQVLTPATPLTDIEGLEYAKLQDALRRKGWSSPVRFPRTKVGALVDLSLHCLWPLSAILSVVAICSTPMTWPFAILAAMVSTTSSFLAIALLRDRCLFRKGLPSSDTVGGLAQDVARLNLRRLRAGGATGLSRAIVWGMLTHGTANRSASVIWDFD